MLGLLEPDSLVHSIEQETQNILVEIPHCLHLIELLERNGVFGILGVRGDDVMNSCHDGIGDMRQILLGTWYCEGDVVINVGFDHVREVFGSALVINALEVSTLR